MFPDDALIEGMVHGSEVAFVELYARYAPYLGALARRMLQNPEDIQRSVEDIFVDLWQRAAQYDPRRVRAATWIVIVAHRHILNTAFKRKLPSTLLETWDAPDQVVSSSGELPDANFKQAAAILTAEERELIELALFQHCNYRELANVTGKPLRTVTTMLRSSLARIYDYLYDASKTTKQPAGADQ
jgi:RNA polymerase sigma-70 factor (ECF subfamily)